MTDSLYLSRLILNPRSRRVQRELASSYELHRSLMRAFPDDLEDGDERVLFRLDIQRNGMLGLLVQSWGLPDWSWLSEPSACDYLLPVSEPNPAVKPFDLNFAPGQTLAFRLRANPTTKHWLSRDRNNPAGEKKPMRVGIYDDDALREWLARKGQVGGFQLLRVAIAKEGNTCGWQPLGKAAQGEEQRPKARQLTLHAVQFDGFLQVADPTRLRETVCQGIGSGKGLGFGLLSLARPL